MQSVEEFIEENGKIHTKYSQFCNVSTNDTEMFCASTKSPYDTLLSLFPVQIR